MRSQIFRVAAAMRFVSALHMFRIAASDEILHMQIMVAGQELVGVGGALEVNAPPFISANFSEASACVYVGSDVLRANSTVLD